MRACGNILRICELSYRSYIHYSVYFLSQTELNPVENAIDTVNDNHQTLLRLYKRVMSDRNQSTNPLTMKLNGTLDAAVNGGLRLYEVFFTEEYQQQNPDHIPKIKNLRKAMQELVSDLWNLFLYNNSFAL